MHFKRFRDNSPLWTLIFLLAVVSCSPVKGLVIKSSEPVVAAPGDNVILPCQLDPAIEARNLILEWTKLDFKPDPSAGLDQNHYVHLYWRGREVLDLKLPSYISRTQLFTEELQHGNMSLKILNVTSGDAGRYRCFIPNLRKHAVVQLVVETRTTETPPYSGDLQTPDPRDETEDKEVDQTRHRVWIVPVVFCSLVLTAVVVVGVLIKLCQNLTQTQRHDGV